MTRTFTLVAALAAGFAGPAFAGDAPATTADAQAIQSQAAHQAAIANQSQMRAFLAAQGYIVTSDLNRDDSGRWVGTALKNGKVVAIAVKMPPRTPAASLTN
jgi:hypothetical protein